MKTHSIKRSNRSNEENNQEDEEDALKADEFDQETEELSTIPSGKKNAKLMRRLKKKVVDMVQEELTHPTESYTPALRKSLILENTQNGTMKGHIDEAAALLCVFCSKGASDDEELIDCQGLVNQIMRKTECKAKFHLKCIMNYNHGAFLFQYAARPECQNKLLCPLHCCTACNSSNRKQTAYEGKLTECALCLRSFHTDMCLPVGSAQILVELQTEERQVQVPMIICPFHAKLARRSQAKHVNACINCTDPSRSGLTKCKNCIRMYHKTCQKVKMINGKPTGSSVCDHCLGSNVIRFNVPLLGRWKTGGFFLCVARPWDISSSMHKAAHFGEVGYTVVDWVVEEKWSILKISDICELTKAHLALDSPEPIEYWKQGLEAFNEFRTFPPRYKEAHRIGKASRHYDKSATKLFQFHEVGVCGCEGANRCSTDDCIYVASGCECPPECSRYGRICKNRNVSEHKEHRNMELRKAGAKGFGVFAKGPIKKGEYLAEYVGELINKAEKDKRLLSVQISKDHEANHYMMDVNGGMTVDATRYGNVTRYMNHSCEPNAGSFHVKIFVKNAADDEHSWFDYRAYIKAMRDIAKDEEITFDYGMKSNDAVPDCKCGSVRCTGRLTKKKDREEDVDHIEQKEEEKQTKVVAVPRSKSGRQRATTPHPTLQPTTTPRKRGRRSCADLELEGCPPTKKRVSRPPETPETNKISTAGQLTLSQGHFSNQNPQVAAPRVAIQVATESSHRRRLVKNPKPRAQKDTSSSVRPRGRARHQKPPILVSEVDNENMPNLPIIENQNPPILAPEAPTAPAPKAARGRRRTDTTITRPRGRKLKETPVARAPKIKSVRSEAPVPESVN